jgi:hypothetical protein
VKKTQADYWAPRINAEWRKSVAAILGVGTQLIAAKESCEHGEFLRLFKGHENAVGQTLPFTLNTAERLMAVARHPVLSNSAHVQSLPQSWGTLYELTKLDDDTLIAGIKAGEITPETTRAQAAALHVEPVSNMRARRSKPARTLAAGTVRVPRWLVALGEWAERDCGGYALDCIAIESDGFYATVVATDGRRMAVVSVPQADTDERQPQVGQFLIPISDLARAIKRVPPRYKPGSRLARKNGDGCEHFVTVEAGGNGCARVASADGTGVSTSVNLGDGRYPKWRDVLNRRESDQGTAMSFCCNPDWLKDISELARAAKAGRITIRATQEPALLGAFETDDGCSATVLVMGMADVQVAEDQSASDPTKVIVVTDDTTPKVCEDISPTLRSPGHTPLVLVPVG